jgi:hypothetical protein
MKKGGHQMDVQKEFEKMISKNEGSKKERDQKRLEMKLRALENPDTIFILPYAAEGFRMAFMVRDMDKLTSLVKRKIGISIDVNRARSIFNELEELAGKLWDFVYQIAPNLHSINKMQWRKINDDFNTKKALCSRKSSIAVTPRSEESAMIAMAVKIIQQKNVELRQTSSFEDLQKFVEKYTKTLTGMDGLLIRLSGELDYKYKSRLADMV